MNEGGESGVLESFSVSDKEKGVLNDELYMGNGQGDIPQRRVL